MTMRVKTMEFDSCVVSYDYNTSEITITEKERDISVTLKRGGVQELKEALEGIGQQISPGAPTFPPGARRR